MGASEEICALTWLPVAQHALPVPATLPRFGIVRLTAVMLPEPFELTDVLMAVE